jgi:hypothetical protein
MGMRSFVADLSRCVVLAAALLAGHAGAADLSATERRWLEGAWPVIAHARSQGLPLDIVVQPQPTPGQAPLALGFVVGRCKLVLSMRGNPEAEATLARIAPELLDATLELMAAHELGHCQRHLDGAWTTLPVGHAAPGAPAQLDPALHAAYAQLQTTRREEAYADLVGLAWVERRHPAHYARLHAWVVAERRHDLLPGSHHDTLAWLQRAERGVAGATDGSIFVAAQRLWVEGFGEPAPP